MTAPIRPDDLQGKNDLPEPIVEIVNELVRGGWDGLRSVVRVSHLQNMICGRIGYVEPKWIDGVPLFYERCGWHVTEDVNTIIFQKLSDTGTTKP